MSILTLLSHGLAAAIAVFFYFIFINQSKQDHSSFMKLFILSIFIVTMALGSGSSIKQYTPNAKKAKKHIKYNEIKIHNKCYKPIRVALVVKNRKGQWKTKSWWRLNPYEKNYFGKTYSQFYYYYAQSIDNQIEWGSNDLNRFMHGKNRGFKEVYTKRNSRIVTTVLRCR